MKIPRMTEEEYQFLKPTPVSVMVWMTPDEHDRVQNAARALNVTMIDVITTLGLKVTWNKYKQAQKALADYENLPTTVKDKGRCYNIACDKAERDVLQEAADLMEGGNLSRYLRTAIYSM